MPDIPRTMAQQFAGVHDHTGVVAHIFRLSEACDKLLAAQQRLEAENAALRQMLTARGEK